MSAIKTKLLPKFELLIIAIFFLGFMVWGISRCNTTRAKYAQKDKADQVIDSLSSTSTAALPDIQPKPPIQPDTAQATRVETRTVRERYTPLYVTIDGVNVRREPKLNAAVIARLKLYEEVAFLNEVTDFRQEIVLGSLTTNEPWIKIKTAQGKVGWVYGATVSYYKRKLEGVD